MKHIKKVVAYALTLVMAFALALPAFAATIAVTDVVDGETYTAYKILNYTENGETGTDRAVSYFLTAEEYNSGLGAALESAGFAFTKSADGTQYFVSNASEFDPAAAASTLAGNENIETLALDKVTAVGENGEANFEDLDTGYYFVTTTTGSLCALHEDGDIADLVEKNTIPTVDKKQSVDGQNYIDALVELNIGDTVHYEIAVTDGTGTNNAITLTDTLTAGLTYTAGSLKINGDEVADDADTDNWTVTIDGQVMTIVLKAAYVASLDKGAPVNITYDAVINEKAVVDSATGNENKIELDYSQQHLEDKTYVATYDFLVKKTDGTDFLDGAEFKLYDAATEGNQIKLSKDETGCYVDANGSDETTIDINSADGVNVRGLKPGTYYLEEVVVPNGYNKLAGRQEVTITEGGTAAVDIIVVNHAGTELPSTGGIGTTIFYIVGGIMVVGAVVVLLAKRRAASTEE